MRSQFMPFAATCLFVTALSTHARATCKPKADSELSSELARAEHALQVKTRQLEKARAELKLKSAAYEAATSELAKNPDGGTDNTIQAAAAALHDADGTKKDADDAVRAAEDARDCILRQMKWAGSVTAPVRVAGGAGERWMVGVGLRLNLRTSNSPRELHHFGVDYLSLHNFGFDEGAYDAAGSERVASAYYEYRYKNLIVGPAAALRVSKRSNDGDLHHSNAWLIGHIGFDVDTELTIPGACSHGCGIASGSVFVEPWFPMERGVPVSVVVGLELQLGGGWGQPAKSNTKQSAEAAPGKGDEANKAGAVKQPSPSPAPRPQ